MVRRFNQLVVISTLMLFLLLSSGCHHIHIGYSIPMYMQPKGFSMTYKEYLYSTPIHADYSRELPGENQPVSQPVNQETKNCLNCDDSRSDEMNSNTGKIKNLIEKESIQTHNQKIRTPHVAQSLPLPPPPLVRTGQRESVPYKALRSNRRF
ncbi:hypothetical protein MNBD_PLANCTO02-312 [hydrothermal vent metagenome]|uniref:Lipoprotein n=1 Tax=hydrothermal vent metagenome TaxID=652676 RepID=A0A3B1DVH2_9ZZZZ